MKKHCLSRFLPLSVSALLAAGTVGAQPMPITSKGGPGTIWSGLLGENHPDFKMLLADRIYLNFFNNGAMTPARCDARLVARMDEIRDSYLAESARWGRERMLLWSKMPWPFQTASRMSLLRGTGRIFP